LEAIDQALADLRQKEEDKALVKTMESVNALKKYVTERKEFSRTPPSLAALLTSSEETLKQIGRIIQEDSDVYVDPTGLTLSEILLIKLRYQSGVSPLDNVLARPKVQRPRIKRLNLDFFKLVRRYCLALQQ
jgi:hypothetical protein